MAEYTMELRQIVNSDCHQVFDFDYPFYCETGGAKQEFEELFINRYYFHEIGAETIERWQWMLKARLNLIMPYYTQLYQTEWYNVKSKELMMTSKNTVDTFEREIIEDGTMTSNTQQSNENSQSSSSQATSKSSSKATGEGTSGNHHKESNIQDGVTVSLTDEGYLTMMSQDDSTTSSEAETSADSTDKATASTSANGRTNSQTKDNEHKKLIEKTTQTSVGDVGIQTPAYAITEWRKIIININEMILNDCKDLFMLIY